MSFDGTQAFPPRDVFQPHTTFIADLLIHHRFQSAGRHFVGELLFQGPEDPCFGVIIAANPPDIAALKVVGADGKSIAIVIHDLDGAESLITRTDRRSLLMWIDPNS